MAKSLMHRFLSKVEKTDYCWEWMAAKNPCGYGVMRYSTQVSLRQATHVAVELFRPDDIRPSINYGIMHSCDNPGCVNPDHLKWGTPAENQLDKVIKNRQRKGESHPFAKLSLEQVEQIRSLCSEGKTQREVGELFNVSNQQVSRIINNKRWKKEGNQNSCN